MTNVRRLDQLPQAQSISSVDQVVIHQTGRTRRATFADLGLLAGADSASILAAAANATTAAGSATAAALAAADAANASATVASGLSALIFEAQLRQLGFIGDGASHPLQQKFSTLAAAQAVFPRATALAEEIDGHAVQKMADNQTASGKRCVVRLPDGCYAQTSFPIRTGAVPTVLYGCNSFITQRTAGADCWHHGTADTGYQTVFGATFTIEGVEFACNGVGGKALRVEQDPRTGTFIMNRVGIHGAGSLTDNYWQQAIHLTGTSRCFWSNCAITGPVDGNIDAMGDGVYLTYDTARFPAPLGQFIFVFEHVDISWYFRPYNIEATKTTEGFWFSGGNWNTCARGPRFYNSANTYSSPQVFIDRVQMDLHGQALEFFHFKYVNITNCLLLMSGNKVRASDGAPITSQPDYSWDVVAIRENCTEFNFTGNTIEMYSGCKPRTFFNVNSKNVQNVTIANNKWRVNDGANLIAIGDIGEAADGGGVDQGKYGIREYNNTGLIGFAWSAWIGGAIRSKNNYSMSAMESLLLTAGNDDRLASVNHETGIVTLIGTRVATPTASGPNWIMEVALPAGIFGAIPTRAVVSWGDGANVSGTAQFVTPTISAFTLTKAVFQINGYTSGSGPRRISFTLSQ